jgi:hypothetical protein
MSGAADLTKAQLLAAIAKLSDAAMQVVGTKGDVTEVGITTNTATTETTDSIHKQLNSIGLLKEGINLAEIGLIGSANDNATGVLIWLNEAEHTLTDDAQRLNILKGQLEELSRQISSITTNHDETVMRIRGAIDNLRAHVNSVL